jgi:serine/threonine protein kinase/tetratricopeptide (TPR) repeat protein
MAGERRATWLAEIAERDAALASELESLLVEHDGLQQDEYLEHTTIELQPAAAGPSMEGQVIGAYRLLSLIGQGGMGSVWLAERCDGRFAGQAAVKLLNVALVGRAVEERFRREGDFLAKVTHAHIARLFDAGVSSAGQPYLVLEHVDGQPIDSHCDEAGLGIDARIALFLDVLEAVAHAHANLIVHRDIKPANVLVSVTGDVKLLDFGIAKLLDDEGPWSGSEGAAASALTQEAGTALTLQFAAPEQLAKGPVTTATDIYSLGVLLYVVLTGQHPVGADLESPAALIRSIVDVEPRRMSDVVRGGGHTKEALEAIAARRSTTVSRLHRTLRGDLDTIVAKALRKNATERYVSVSALTDDLRRYLLHEPISARPEGPWGRAVRFVQRHKRGVAATAAGVVVLAGVTAFYTNRLATERDRAQREAAKAARVSEALSGLLRGADPIANRASADGFTVTGLLDSATDRVKTELADQPDAQAEIFTIIGRMYRRIGLYDKAQQLLEQALASGRAAFGPEHASIAQTLNDLGALAAEKGDDQAAAANLEAALAIRRRIYGVEHTEVANTLAELGRIYQDQGANGRAEPLHREALAIRRTLLGDGAGETGVSLSDLASVLRLNGDLDGADALLRQSLEINRQTRGDAHAMTATTLHDSALVAGAKGNQVLAETMFRDAMGIHRKTLGDGHPLVAVTLNSLSRVLRDQGREAEAAAALEQALSIARPALGSDHQLIAIYALNLGAVQLARGDPRAAETLIREGLRIRQRSPQMIPNRRRIRPEDDWTIGAARDLLGAALAAQQRYAEAETALLEARRDLEALSPPPRREVRANLTRLAELYAAWGKPAEAARYRALAAATP